MRGRVQKFCLLLVILCLLLTAASAEEAVFRTDDGFLEIVLPQGWSVCAEDVHLGDYSDSRKAVAFGFGGQRDAAAIVWMDGWEALPLNVRLFSSRAELDDRFPDYPLKEYLEADGKQIGHYAEEMIGNRICVELTDVVSKGSENQQPYQMVITLHNGWLIMYVFNGEQDHPQYENFRQMIAGVRYLQEPSSEEDLNALWQTAFYFAEKGLCILGICFAAAAVTVLVVWRSKKKAASRCVCASCGSRVMENNRFCPMCGMCLNKKTETTEP